MRLLAICWAWSIAATSFAAPLPVVAPERVGFSKEGLSRIDKFFEREIAANRVPGAVVAIARDGKLVYWFMGR
jgi:CubicO group peptidase (beta-lactamase class C family)